MLVFKPSTRAGVSLRSFRTLNLHDPNTNLLLQEVHYLCICGNLQEAVSLFYTLKVPQSHSHRNSHSHHQTYATLFQTCARLKCLQQGQDLHSHMISHKSNNPPDLYVTNHLINMYAKCGCLEIAHHLFDEMPQRNIVSWTALISGYAQQGMADGCFSLFSEMLSHYRPTEFAYTSVLTLCDYDCGRQVHSLAFKTSFDAYVYVANALITMYSKSCGVGVYDDEDKDEAWRVFKNMEFRNLITWNSIIAGFQVRGLGAKAMTLFSLMHFSGIGFDRATLLSLFASLCGSNSNGVDSCWKFCTQLHCCTIKTGFILEIGVATALVKAYSSLGGEVSDCYKLFLETSGRRDVVSWTGIITTMADRDPEEALILFCQLRQEGLAPDRYTFSSVLKACAGLVTERHALAVHSQVIKEGFEDDVVLANALIHAYARCGSIARSEQVFNEMVDRDTVSWNSMLKAHALNGQAKEALTFFAQMNVPPDETTFVSLLSACSHAGMVEEGTKIFDAMFKDYGIEPRLDHFACMVDIFGRAGKILEAEKLISDMPMEPDSIVWSALLGACRKHGETRLADLAASKLRELDPDNSLGYVMMSNIYCSAGSFNEAGLMRKQMKGLGVRKRPGLSWTEIGNRMHEFASGGQRHPQLEAIRANLEELIGQLKDLGYKPETSLALHDVEEEQKEEQLYYHSEKLALVFALMNSSGRGGGGGGGGGDAIRIIKNIRICLDCHNFMKLASQFVQREIVVRDSNRFHHFKGRACSCNDYW